MHSSSHSCPIEIIMEFIVGKIYICFACFDKLGSGSLPCSVYNNVDELRSLTFIGLSYIPMLLKIVVREPRYCRVYPESAIGTFP